MDLLAFDASGFWAWGTCYAANAGFKPPAGNQLQIMELHIFADKNGADAVAPGTYVGSWRVQG